MFDVIVIMSIGILIGTLIHKNKNTIQLVERFVTYAIWLLLFFMGTSIGANEIIIKNIGTLGLQALLLSLSAIIGSVFLAYLLYRFFFKNEK
ncbi:MAG: LysO family transporter [Nanoarchaeota archaeon]